MKFWRYLRQGIDYAIAAKTGIQPTQWRKNATNEVGDIGIARGTMAAEDEAPIGAIQHAGGTWLPYAGWAMVGAAALYIIQHAGIFTSARRTYTKYRTKWTSRKKRRR